MLSNRYQNRLTFWGICGSLDKKPKKSRQIFWVSNPAYHKKTLLSSFFYNKIVTKKGLTFGGICAKLFKKPQKKVGRKRVSNQV